MPLCEKSGDDPQSQTEAMKLTSGRYKAELITASLPLIVVVIDRPRLTLAQTRILGFLTYPMCLGEILRFCAGEKVPRPVAVNSAISRNVPCMLMEAR